ncbi:lipopolysaccharide heptosyltransferase II [Rickettsiella endosymbiont of Miltochrista miniata]|uniref:lipopolysaccharide heptosyltransferase II n=1 Tax=Rickettsiella endosymbiont of Miltochrista miniata TaxID=3066239 RepID=UPI00313CBD94
MNSPKKILIISPAWIGDIVIAQSLFKYIKHGNSETIIDVLAPAWSHELYSAMPEINEIFTMPLGHSQFQLKKRWRLGKGLRNKNYLQAIILPNSWKSAIIPFAAGIPIRTGWLGEMRFGLLNDWRILNKKIYPMMVQRFLALGDTNALANKVFDWKIFQPHLEINHNHESTKLKSLFLIEEKPLLILCPGAAYGPAKCWPAEYFAEIANYKKSKAWQIVLLGSKSDESMGQKIQKLTKNACINLIGKTSLLEALNVLSFATLVISNDSGLMHLTAALERPLIALYGSSSPEFTPPLSKKAKIISLKLSCSPCFERECPLVHFKCLKQLTPQIVLNAIDDLIKNEALFTDTKT